MNKELFIKNIKFWNLQAYRDNYLDLNKKSEHFLLRHVLNHGIKENRNITMDGKNIISKKTIKKNFGLLLPNNFEWKDYISLHDDLQHMNENDAKCHYILHGNYENRKFTFLQDIIDDNINPLRSKGYDENHNIKLTFVTTCFNRFWQLKQVYYNNVKLYSNNSNVKFILADFNGNDSNDIEQFIKRNFPIELITGKLSYYKRKESLKKFDVSKAKNFVCSIVDDDNIIYNLDGDNILLGDEYETINNFYIHNGDNIIVQMNDGPPNAKSKILNMGLNLFSKNELIEENEMIWNGTCGRMIFSKKIFDKVNGYPESFTDLALEDLFFILNCVNNGVKYIHKNLSKPSLFIHNDRDKEYEEFTRKNLVLFKRYLQSSDNYVNPTISEKKDMFIKLNNEFMLTCFTILYKVSDYIDNFIKDLREQTIFENIYFKLYNFPETNSNDANKKINELKSFPNIEIEEIKIKDDKKLYYYWNDSIKNCNTQFISSFNPDDKRGPLWAETLLNSVEPNAHIICGLTIPFTDLNMTYEDILKSNKIWFDKKKGLNKEGNLISIETNDYITNPSDLFQICNCETLSFTIPNSSPIWDISVHKDIGEFADRDNEHVYSDFEIWLKFLKNNKTIKVNKNYKVGFYISENQYHKQPNSKNVETFNELIRNYASKELIYFHFNKHTKFNLSMLKDSFGKHHLKGWNWVKEQFLNILQHHEKGIILDIFVERTFHKSWGKNIISTDFVYSSDWIGFIHTTPKIDSHKNQLDDENYLENLTNNTRFVKSLKYCKMLFCLGPLTKNALELFCLKNDLIIPIKILKHPYPIEKIQNNNVINFNNNIKVNHVGYHLRNFDSFIQLEHPNKRILIPKIWPGMKNDYFIKKYLKNKDTSKIVVENLNNEEYIKLLQNEIIFIDFLNCSASNVICECIAYSTPLVVNRIPEIEYYLGKDYPLYFDDIKHASLLIKDYDKILNAINHMKQIRYEISWNNFEKKFLEHCTEIYNTEIYNVNKSVISNYIKCLFNDLNKIEDNFKLHFFKEINYKAYDELIKIKKNKIEDNVLLNKKVFIGRSGSNSLELYLPFIFDIDSNLIDLLLNNENIKNEITTIIHDENGVYDTNKNTYINTIKKYLKMYISSVKNCTHFKINSVEKYNNFAQKWFSLKFDKVYDFNTEWNNFLIHSFQNKYTLSWLEFFRNKKLLFITSFPETMKKQYNSGNVFKMFGIEPFLMNIQFCKSPVSFCSNTPHSNVLESFDYLKNEVKEKNFDIAIIGCGGYSMLIGNYIFNEMNKSAIVVGGTIQLMFGIKGKRWSNHNIYNEYWCNVLTNEVPNNKTKVEDGCYF